MTLGVRAGLRTGQVVPSFLQPSPVGGFVDLVLAVISGGVDKGLWDVRAVVGAFDEEEALEVPLHRQLVGTVVIDRLVAEGGRRQLEVLNRGARVGAVGGRRMIPGQRSEPFRSEYWLTAQGDLAPAPIRRTSAAGISWATGSTLSSAPVITLKADDRSSPRFAREDGALAAHLRNHSD